METRRLHNADINQIVRILRTDPHSPADPGGIHYEKATQAAIKKLSRRLRSLPISYHGSLCRTHKGLDVYLINDVWSWIKFELEVAIGRFLYPIVMSGILSEADEYRVRQLEPVVRMFNIEWTFAESAAPGKTPIDAGIKWTYQENGCPACMLARIGSDEDALFALFACMYGHLRSRSNGQKGVHKIRSKRLRFVRYWMKTHPNGEQSAREAYDLGVELKALRRDAKASLRHSKRSTHYTRDSIDEAPVATRHCLDDQPVAALDVSDPYHSDNWTANKKHDSKIGPIPPPDLTAHTVIGDRSGNSNQHHADLRRANINIQPPTPHSTHTIEQDLLSPLGPLFLSHANLKRRDSIINTTSTIRPRPSSSVYSIQNPSLATLGPSRAASSVYSTQKPPSITLSPARPSSYAYSTPNDSRLTVATSIASYNEPTKRSNRERGYDAMETLEERLNRYRKAMVLQPFDLQADKREAVVREGDFRYDVVQYEVQLLPKPSRCSMYSAFGEEGRDGEELEAVDETPLPSPADEGFGEEVLNEYEHVLEDPALAPLQLRKHEQRPGVRHVSW